ncbi:hypothetical protein QWY31_05610 [Cytophagales bacterium LB-30]|uniref:Prokaryotic glutathione synthetase ATP-binding domain-containing protein n=1 Tax=Shiella aurantiaca TaxID=3058365 RepID=A0ABT8F3D0_9BACT|nr:hypothetical protein [Shiella aurantiaca]MDN4164968.1 hypothetical protein [Shiella aurantiaca]
MKNKNLALVTYAQRGSFGSAVPDEDLMVKEALEQKGFTVDLQVWDDESVNWETYEAVIIKSPWDYFDKPQAWFQWLEKMQALGSKVLNPVEILNWNSDKNYLLQMAAEGFSIVPTRVVEKPEQLHSALFDTFGLDKLVMKPKISGGAKQTVILHQTESESLTKYAEWVKEEAYLIQPFMEEVATVGEYSYVFFNGKFSHALLKTPSQGDFRVQHYFGGTIQSVVPSEGVLAQAQAFIDQYAKGCLYARVDGVLRGEKLFLMELELIEPYLFLFTHPQALEHYTQALIDMLNE